ncbi:MAG TPA: BON domain-containing protein [Pyrinomonadaceae bacterium]|nr:BON domain-containing protein [Pyrinomonadaceae bacterium]
MSTRYDDRDRDRNRDRERNQRNYGGRSSQDYDRSYGQSGQSGWGSDDDEQRYAGESRRQYGTGRAMYRGGGDYESRDWGSAEDYSSERNRNRYGDEYGSSYGAGYERGEGRYRDTQSGSGGRSYGEYRRGGWSGEGRGYGQERGGYENRGSYERPGGYEGRRAYENRGGYEGRSGYEGRYEGRGGYGEGEGEERGWWDRFSDTVASWFGDEEAERRRRAERPYQGRGPKGYRRSDERIKEDINDRLSEGYLDATEVDVQVSSGEVVLTGTVDSRMDKRRAEYIAENVSGVRNVENRLRAKDRYQTGSTYGMSEGTSMGTPTPGTSATGAYGTGTSATGTTGTTGTGTTGTTGTSTGAKGKTAST